MRLPARLALGLTLITLAFAAPARSADQPDPPSREGITLTFAPLVKKAAPAVVNIYAKRTVKTTGPVFEDPIFRHFFGELGGIPRERVQRSLGSGVILRPDGLIVTNDHVIKDAEEITVVLSDRREFAAKLLGADERTDLAVLKIDAGAAPLAALPTGDSDALEVGDLVLAIGDPFGVGQTVTMGIVSALARTSIGVSDYRFFIQTDAAINPGNSGGALIDVKGRVVGINSAIFTQSGGSVGIGFAIPINMVKVVVAGIASGGHAVRPWLGAGGQAVTAESFQALHLERPVGVLVNSVRGSSPAEAAGIKVGDVIVAIDGHEVDDPEALRYRIATKAVDAIVRVTVSRLGHESDIEVHLAAPPETPPRQPTYIEGRVPFQGATIANLNPALAEEIGIEGVEQGVIIVDIRPGTIAARLDLHVGDRIIKLNGTSIKTVNDLIAAGKVKVDKWQVSLAREGQVINLTIGEN